MFFFYVFGVSELIGAVFGTLKSRRFQMKLISYKNRIFDDFRSVAFWRPFWTMSDGLAKVLEGRNVLTHNGTSQAI